MSDLSMYELEDIIWDDFDRGDDDIVPHPTNARTSRNSFEGDNCKKPRQETTPVFSNATNLDVSNADFQGKAESNSKTLDIKKSMTEKDSLSHTPPGVFNASGDGEIVKDMPNLASDDTKMSNNCFKSCCGVGDTSAAGDNNSYSYQLAQIPEAGDLCFVDNNCQDNAPSDLLYYSWPDIGNFEHVDKMLRSCDSSFGLGVTDNDDELVWFTSDQTEGTEDALKMDFKFPCPEPSGLKNTLQDNDSPESNNQRSSCISVSKDEPNFKDQINLQKKPFKHQNQTEGKNLVEGVGNDGSFYQISDLTSNDSQLSSNNKSHQAFTSLVNRQQYRNLEFDYFGHMQSNNSYLSPDYLYQTKDGPMLSGIKSEHKGLKSHSPKGSFYASSQSQSMESSGDPFFEGTVPEADERKQTRNPQGFQPLFIGSPRQMGTMFQFSNGVLVPAKKQAHLLEEELESQSDIEGGQKGADIVSLNARESSSTCPELDEISLEATSFRQLRHVMEQLDLRTKLCIRDSLYRLARSAEQRHNNSSLSSGASDINDLGGPLMADRTNKCTGFMDIETDTNPIDRIMGLFRDPQMIAEKLVCQYEAAAELNEKIGGD